MGMKRTTIMAEEELLEGLREVARDQGISLAEVIRQGLAWRLATHRRVPSFLYKTLPATGRKRNYAAHEEEDIARYIDEKFARS